MSIEAPDKVWNVREVPDPKTGFPGRKPSYQAVVYARKKRAEGMHYWHVDEPLSGVCPTREAAARAVPVTIKIPHRDVVHYDLALRLEDLVPIKHLRSCVRLGAHDLLLIGQHKMTARGPRTLVGLCDDERFVMRLGRFSSRQVDSIYDFASAYDIAYANVVTLPLKKGKVIDR